MHISNSHDEFLSQVAIAADLTLKPWSHSVIDKSEPLTTESEETSLDMILTIQCRNKEGVRFPKNDIELEIYQSGKDLSVTLSWESFPEKPMLWHGNYSLWMDSATGKRCDPPVDGSSLEALARRIRTFVIIED